MRDGVRGALASERDLFREGVFGAIGVLGPLEELLGGVERETKLREEKVERDKSRGRNALLIHIYSQIYIASLFTQHCRPLGGDLDRSGNGRSDSPIFQCK